MSQEQPGNDGGQVSRGGKKAFSLWPVAITVIVIAVLVFGVYVVNRVLDSLEREKKAEMFEGALERVMRIEGEKVAVTVGPEGGGSAPAVTDATGPTARDYGSLITVSVVPSRKQVKEGERLVVVRGTVRNDGPRNVVFLKVGFSFVNENGEAVFFDDDLLAHQYPFGSNSTPVPAHGEKSFECDWWVPVTWDGNTIKTEILEVGLEPESG